MTFQVNLQSIISMTYSSTLSLSSLNIYLKYLLSIYHCNRHPIAKYRICIYTGGYQVVRQYGTLVILK